jgi:lysophospholipase L1-like esterase
MHRQMTFGVTAILLWGQLAILAGMAEAADFDPVPAAVCRERDGLGNVLAKLAAGDEVRIAYFGGSITQNKGWRLKTLDWFQKEFPKATVREIQAAISGTGSELGAFRCQQDVLRHKPDLIFVEFSVNDRFGPPETICRAMEGIVRQTWQADPTIDLCFVYTFQVGYEKDLDRGLCPPATSVHERVAEHYGIPSINVALGVAKMAREGKLVFKAAEKEQSPALDGKLVFSRDGVHPYDAGHAMYAQTIAEAVQEMRQRSQPGSHELKTPLREDNWERAKLVPIHEKMLHGSWKKMDPQQEPAKEFNDKMPVIWEGTTPGDRIEFRFKGTMVRLYDLVGPDGGQVVCTVDGEAGEPRPLFDEFCYYYRLCLMPIADDMEDKEHTVSITIQSEQPDRSSVLKNKPDFDLKRCDGTKAWAGYLLMIGEPVE